MTSSSSKPHALSPHESSTEKKHAAWVDLLSGGFGSAFAKTLLSPLQRIVVLKQLGDNREKSTLQLMHMIKEKEGMMQGFWRGNLTSVMIRFPYGGFQFLIFGKTKFFLEEKLGLRQMHKDHPSSNSQQDHNTNNHNMSPMAQKFLLKGCAGGFSATIAGCLVYPGEVVRLRLMSGDERYRSILPTIRHIWQETHSPRNFYKGLNASLLQRVPDILINFAVYETVKAYLDEEVGTPDTLNIMVAGSCAAVSSIVACFPLDVAKRRIGMAAQLRNTGHDYSKLGVVGTLQTVLKEEGIVKGWYGGAALEAGRCMPQVVIMWFAIEYCRSILSQFEDFKWDNFFMS